MDIDLKKETKRIATDTVNSTIMSIQIGFTLATALAFNEYIKKLLASSLNKQGASGYLKYAITVALVSGIVLSITSRYSTSRINIEKEFKKIEKELA
tara:strand:+ start:1470 stop:1760 length:291 start_codon:yes stop_codon:yes gene_type:complete